ncbi:MAG: hypothetical protein F4Z35_06465 [Dehalococcoidia bacterium]|nr:hypothetical protein [Dehalococcoidia bacterium]
MDTEPPSVATVRITSRPTDGEAYRKGDVVSVEVTFSEQVTPSGDPQLELDIGGVSRRATLQTVSGQTFRDSLVFEYTVKRGDRDDDGIGIGANSLKLNDGGLYDIAGNSAGPTHDVVVVGTDHRVDTTVRDHGIRP